MLVVTRHVVRAAEQEAFREAAEAACEVLQRQPGCRAVQVARAIDDATVYLLVSSWKDVGSYRRALSNFDVKLAAVPVLASASDEVSAFEVLSARTPAGLEVNESDLAPDADTAGPA